MLIYRAAVLIAFSLAIAAPSTATVIYHYTGVPFTHFLDETSPSGSFTTSDFVSVTLEFAAPLAADSPPQDVEPNLLSFRVSDGRSTLTDSSAVLSAFVVGTDAFGAIDEWYISAQGFLFEPTSVGEQAPLISTTNQPNAQNADYGNLFECTAVTGEGVCTAAGTDLGSVEFVAGSNAGTWTVIPEPTTALLLGLGLMGLGVSRRWR